MQISKAPPSTMQSFRWMDCCAHISSYRSYKKPVGVACLISIAVALYVFLHHHVSKDPFAIHFCDADGTCHEKPDQPSPRTIYSAKSKEQYDQWWSVHANLNRTAQAYATRRGDKTHAANSRPLILLGDSITESWVGTDMGREIERAKGIPQVLQAMILPFSSSSSSTSDTNNDTIQHDTNIPLDPLVLAIGGDQTQHLLYRLQNGQLLPAYANDETAIFVMLIGTNNLGSGELPGPAAKGVLAVADHILSNTHGHLVLLKLLPRGDAFRLERLCPPRCKSNDQPLPSFMPAVTKVNEAVARGMEAFKEQYGPRRMGLVECGPKLFQTSIDGDGPEVDTTLMPDSLHPNAAGHRILANCITEYVHGLD